MTTPYNFSNSSSDLYVLMKEVELFKNYIMKQNDTATALTTIEIIEGNHLSMFGAEIFQFWQAARKFKTADKKDLIAFADSCSIPVRDRDLGIDELSWFGRSLFLLWSESVLTRKA